MHEFLQFMGIGKIPKFLLNLDLTKLKCINYVFFDQLDNDHEVKLVKIFSSRMYSPYGSHTPLWGSWTW